MLAKLVAHGRTRDEVRETLATALDATVALGLPTNKAFLAAVLRDPVFAAGDATTAFVAERLSGWTPPAVEASLAKRLYAAASANAAGYGEWACWSNAGRAQPPGVAGVLDGSTLHFARSGHSYMWRDTTMDPPAKGTADFDGRGLTAPMNGRVVAVHAKAGDAVAQGAPLVVLEAMKMEHTLAAPAALRVAAVHVAKGAQVAPGTLLVEFAAA
jgi:acetyl/propionyl-CoA carboxylase alpha subunit